MAQQIEGCRKAKAAGFAMSVTAILGIGGEERTHEHAIGTGKALSAIDPEYIGILSLMLESGTEMTEAVRSGRFVVPEPLDLLRELREIIANIDVTHAVFRSNHASNYLALRGTLPEDKAALLDGLDRVIDAGGRGAAQAGVLAGTVKRGPLLVRPSRGALYSFSTSIGRSSAPGRSTWA